MNNVTLIGRLTRDPETREGSNVAVANFSIAIDRPPKKDGTREADFPRIVVFGKQAENCLQYLSKGRLVAIEGRIQTGSYTNRNGDKVYTTDVVANRVEFLERGTTQQAAPQSAPAPQAEPVSQPAAQPAPAPQPASAPQATSAPQPTPAPQAAPQSAPAQQATPQPEPAAQSAPASDWEAVDDEW